jgi:hypothetical protein
MRAALSIGDFESYLVGPKETSDRTAWRTEIGWPVFHTSATGPAGGG